MSYFKYLLGRMREANKLYEEVIKEPRIKVKRNWKRIIITVVAIVITVVIFILIWRILV